MIWKAVPGFEGLYEVSSEGAVRSLPRSVERLSRWGRPITVRFQGRVLKPARRPDGHLVVTLSKGGAHTTFFVHELVLIAFVGERPAGLEARHLDGVPSNNHSDNLKWGTRVENIHDRKAHGHENPARGERHPRAVLTEERVLRIRAEVARGRSQSSVARDLGVHRAVVHKVITGRTWGWLCA